MTKEHLRNGTTLILRTLTFLTTKTENVMSRKFDSSINRIVGVRIKKIFQIDIFYND
jgi:hypothetical protein